MTRTAWTCPSWAKRTLGILRSIFGVCSLAVITVIVISLGGATWNFFFFLLYCGIFVTALCLVRPLSAKALAGEKASVLLGVLVIWVFLMVSEAIFSHNQTTSSAANGNVGSNAILQAASWILSFGALALMSCFRPYYLRRLFAGPWKWASIFAIVVVISCPLSLKPAYSAALAFKLCIIVLLFLVIGETVENEDGVFKVFGALFLGMLISVLAEALAPLFRPGPIFQSDGRLGLMIGLSGTCGLLLLLSLLFLWLKKNPWFLLAAFFSIAVMMLAGTKGGMVASFVSLVMFFMLLRKPAQAVAASIGFAIFLILAMALTPLGKSLEKYSESGNAGTLTGRTNLWEATWPEIKSHPILGKGYRASRFLSEEVPGSFQEAGNMHNSFLEVLYNNGLAGLIPMVVMNLLIVVNLRQVLIQPQNMRMRYYAAGAFALYVHLFVWGLVATTVGGAPDNRFMTFFAVFMLSIFLRSQCDKKYWNAAYAEYSTL